MNLKWRVQARGFWVGVALLVLASPRAWAVTNGLVPVGSLWKYLDDGSNQGTAWRAFDFNDSSWTNGFAQFGYDEGDERTRLNFGPNPNNKYITYYFRTQFPVAGASTYTGLRLRVLRDDGVVVYLNGTNIFRNNLPATFNYLTRASSNVSGAAETNFISTNLSAALLRNGTNVLAAEVHQYSSNSADLSFDLELLGINEVPAVTRGPYLQQGTPTNVIVRWRTDSPCDSQVRYGTNLNELNGIASDTGAVREHIVRLADLRPETKYFYSIGTTEQTLAGDGSYFFITAPASPGPTRIWVIGDSGTADERPRSVYTAYTNFTGARYTDLWLMLGDNAYSTGTDVQYQAAVFDMYPELLRQTVLWPTIGNHDTAFSVDPPSTLPYFQIFSLPVNGQAGGVPSGTEKYYSYDYANIHFVCLDAMSSDRRSDGPMCTWLEQDLAANEKDWLIAYWHHPPYTKGSHDSDSENELIEMRENVVPILEAYGVDLVLCGHSHCYERSFLINGHYGLSGTFDNDMKVQPGSGREDDMGPYTKGISGSEANKGAVYVVAGSSGQATFLQEDAPHSAMFLTLLELGSLVLDIDGPELRAKFLRETGVIDDYFTIIKGGGAGVLRIVSYGTNGNTFALTWNSVPGGRYRVERTISLAPAEWTHATSLMEAVESIMSWSVDIGPNQTQAFYRVVRQ
jgi:hypothetical protein